MSNSVTSDPIELWYSGSDSCNSFPQVFGFFPGSYYVELFGGKGGGEQGGLGGYSAGTLHVEKSLKVYFFIGAKGSESKCVSYGGGGIGGSGSTYSGGGATDMRLLNDSSDAGLRSRLIVAGGGGGSSLYNYNSAGGYGGGINGGPGLIGQDDNPKVPANSPTGGTQVSGGYGSFPINSKGELGTEGSTSGSFGIGGSSAGGSSYSAGGGGGYYGGASSSDGHGSISGGSAGSSFISGHPDCDAVNELGTHTGTPYHYSGISFQSPNTEGGKCNGNGYVRITKVSHCQEISACDLSNYFIIEILVFALYITLII